MLFWQDGQECRSYDMPVCNTTARLVASVCLDPVKDAVMLFHRPFRNNHGQVLKMLQQACKAHPLKQSRASYHSVSSVADDTTPRNPPAMLQAAYEDPKDCHRKWTDRDHPPISLLRHSSTPTYPPKLPCSLIRASRPARFLDARPPRESYQTDA
ncbi:hypothetical protein EJ03DRAFT_337533 [Teratosphaeria nubilosa]|uniref:Uncharacterized protein n=1 Tax=Teratosphaeria nubilosa TaxID=161662 RepID=A0A6G1L3P8_9PEZI|nr:hypothetical protein EJ03DRAFT_337533 [Teratosphaeria nubilosa]